jgi:hypothetical protein
MRPAMRTAPHRISGGHAAKRCWERYGVPLSVADIWAIRDRLAALSLPGGGIDLTEPACRLVRLGADGTDGVERWSIDPAALGVGGEAGRTAGRMVCVYSRKSGRVVTFLTGEG